MKSISVQDLLPLIHNNRVTILDLRDREAFESFHLPNAVHIPVTALPNRLSELNRKQTYYIISHSGRRSETLTKFLVANGFHAVHVIGGMKGLASYAA